MFSFLGQTVVLRLTSIPDTDSYQRAVIGGALKDGASLGVGLAMQQTATVITKLIGAVFGMFVGGNPILINIGFQTLGFLGLVYFLQGLNGTARRFAAILVMFPSFSVWSSIASKEAIVVFLTAVVARCILDIYRGRIGHVWWHMPAIVTLWLFKPQFTPAIIYSLGVPALVTCTRYRATGALIAGVATLVVTYLLRDIIDDYVLRQVSGLYSEPGNSNRTVRLIIDHYDYFLHAPAGMILAFIGPTLSEASSGNVLQFASFVESVGLVAMMLVWILPRVPRMPVYLAIVGGFGLFWIMFANYPLGLTNPGTAVRYRTDYQILVILMVVALSSRELYLEWPYSFRRGQSRRRAATFESIPAAH